MVNFIMTYWQYIAMMVAIIAIILVLVRINGKAYLKQMLFFLVVQAEKQFGGGTGELKYAAVTTWIYEKMPLFLKVFFTAKTVDKLIESAVEKMKEYLVSNEKAKSLVESK